MSVPLCCPWRSVWLARGVALIAIIVGVPLFLRMPPWCDLTLYQMAARNILNGGVHYRDIFDTNLPGFVWILTAIQWLFGTSVVAVRAADLLIVLGIVLLIDRLARQGGASLASRWWALTGAAWFYLFTLEMCHAQRDTWMALPVLAAVALRVHKVVGSGQWAVGSKEQDNKTVSALLPTAHCFRFSLAEGVLWGAAVWIKPHVVVMAAAMWLLTVRRIAGECAGPWRAAGRDLLGNLLGGLVVGVAGIGYLVASGTWRPFIEVFTVWNPGYLELVRVELPIREARQLHWFPPWSLGLILTVPLALLSVLDMAPWASRTTATARQVGPLGRWLPRLLWDKQTDADARFARGLLGALYLVWVAQAYYLQRGYEYAHIPETLLMLGVWASHRWAWAFVVLLWLIAIPGAWYLADHNSAVREKLQGLTAQQHARYLPRHPIFNPDRLPLWPTCWRTNLPDAERYALWDRLRLQPGIHDPAIGWEELAEVADYFRVQGATHGEVVAWFSSPHAIYLMMDIDPGIRFMHVTTVLNIELRERGESGHDIVMQELHAAKKRAKFVVNDLEWGAQYGKSEEQRRAYIGPPRNPPHDLLPVCTPGEDKFPFYKPTVFRSRNGHGRYVVHLLQ